jgi:predicted nuclease with TOPRIM domain
MSSHGLQSTLKQKIQELGQKYQQDQKDQESRHLAFMTEAMHLLKTRTEDLEVLRKENYQLQTQLALARQEIQDQRDYIRQLQSLPGPSTATAYMFTKAQSTQDCMLGLSSHSTANLHRGCE